MSDNPYERPSDRPQEGQGSPPESSGPPSGASAYGPPSGEQNPYGQPDPNPYGQPTDQNPYGQPDPNPYGQPPTDPNPYGQPPADPYGPPGDPNAYGQPGYGGTEAAPYGPPYSQGPYGGMPYGMAPQPHPQGTTVLVLGIIGLLVCFIPGIVAVVMGKRALREIDANPAAYNNRQNVQVGRILGIIGIVWQVLVILGYGAVVAALISSGSY